MNSEERIGSGRKSLGGVKPGQLSGRELVK